MKVIYPVCIFQTKDEYMVFVPDLNTNNTSGKTLEEALTMAQDLIATYILEDLEEVGRNEIPKQSKIENINIKEIQKYWEIDDEDIISSFKTLVIVDLDEFLQKWSNKSNNSTMAKYKSRSSKYKFFSSITRGINTKDF